ncbi:MAG: CHASE3 domain-containing protein [bacterium]|nr:CHASE3 domain-containing protein [bacterium]
MALAILAALGGRWVTDRRSMTGSDRLENRAFLVIQQLEALLSDLQDAETGARGFIITGEPAFLEPYNTALRRVEQRLADLRELTNDNLSQQQRLTNLDPLIKARLKPLKQAINLRTTQGFESAREIVMTSQGKALMEEIRQQIAEAKAVESQHLMGHTAEKERDARTTFWLVIIGGSFSAALLFTVFFVLLRENTRRLFSERDLLERSGQLSTSLREKDVLMKELHHRVKNNMQVISSLLQLQSGFIQDNAALAAFRESQGRIKAMGLIHEMLYHSPNLARIDFGDYLRHLTQLMSQSNVLHAGAVTIEVTAEKTILGIDSAVPLALIVNELVANSLKHGFPHGRSGLVHVELSAGSEPARYRLIVRDNGVGVPSGFALGTSPTLGLRIVKMLAEQIGATFEFEARDGLKARIDFGEPSATEVV